MKKNIFLILVIGIILASILVYNVIDIEKSKTKVFAGAGYILHSTDLADNENSVERYYFNDKEQYKQKYDDRISFKDTTGEKITTTNDCFVHYKDGSISSMKKGVVLELSQIDNDPICYYSLMHGQVINKKGNKYVIKNMGKQLEFSNIIWKITNSKYVIAGEKLTIVFNDGTTKEISGFIELEYKDNEIIKLYNQEVTYQTISSDMYIIFNDTSKLNLSTKIISKNKENKMSLDNMVIDSNDNVPIVELGENEEKLKEEEEKKKKEEEQKKLEEEEKKKKEEEEKKNQNNSNEQNNTSNNNENNTNNNINEGSTSTETEVIETLKIVEPIYKVEKFDVTSIGLDAQISIQDDDSKLISDTTVKLIENSTGKVVYISEETLGTYSIEISIATLKQNTDYTLIAEATYDVEGISYTKNFVNKIFRTEKIGIEFNKDIYTNTSLKFNVNFDKNTKVKNAEVVICSDNGEVIQSNKVENINNESVAVEFINLSSNTKYIVKIINIHYENQVLANSVDISEEVLTLKNRPSISNTEYEINKRDGNFILKIKDIKDQDKSISKYRFEIYDARNEIINYVQTIETTDTKVELTVDGNKIQRDVPYMYKVVAIANDNEKDIEVESEFSNIMKMDGVSFPTVRFDTKEVTFERIVGNIIIEDNNNTIDLGSGNPISIVYTDSVGNSNSFTTQGNLVIPVNINNLRANETYKFSVYTKIDLHDGNPAIDKCYIGGAVVKTEVPKNMVAEFDGSSSSASKDTFNFKMQLRKEKPLSTDLEANTLTGITINIYPGQSVSNNPLRTVKMVDINEEPYESKLKEDMYDKTLTISPETFNAQNGDFRDKYYTVQVTEAYDYTSHKNNLPILNNTFTIETNGYMPDLPSDPNNALDVSVIRNRDAGADQRDELDPQTIVGFNVRAFYDNSGRYAKSIKYTAYESETNRKIKEIILPVNEDGDIPRAIFNILDGTPTSVQDENELRRGNSYYFTYEASLDLNEDGTPETIYPYGDTVLRCSDYSLLKQEARIIMYPSISEANKSTYKQKCLDIDNCLVENSMEATIQGAKVSKGIIDNIGSSSFSDIIFTNLAKGNLEISVLQRLEKKGLNIKRVLVSQYFEGANNVSEIKYNVGVDPSKVVITLLNSEAKTNRIVAAKVRFVADDKIVEKDNLKIRNNMIIIGINEIPEMLRKKAKVEVSLYYDNGIYGFDSLKTYHVLQRPYLNGELPRYMILSPQGVLVENTHTSGHMYTTNTTNLEEFTLSNVLDKSLSAKINLQYSDLGMIYEYNPLLQKQVELSEIVCEGSNEVLFDLMIPGISMRDEKDDLTLLAELERVTFKAELKDIEIAQVKNNNIDIEVYETDENGGNAQLVKTITKEVKQFNNPIVIEGLTPKRYYYLKFSSTLITQTGEERKEYLYDIDQQAQGIHYYFSTLANVGIKNVNVEYVANNYLSKTIDIRYDLDRIFGYDKIVYTIYKYNKDTKNYDIIYDNIEDTLLKNKMLKSISAAPGSKFEFEQKYKVKITPIGTYQSVDGNTVTLDLGTVEKEFTLNSLIDPLVGIKGQRMNESAVNFKITIYDFHRIMKDDSYKIQILNEDNVDITPDKYRGEYSSDIINNTFTIDGVDSYKKYTIIVKLKLDKNNDGTTYVDKNVSYVLNKINESGISVGNVTTSPNALLKNKIDLIFYNSYRLHDISQVRYTIYNTNGYAKNKTINFVPSQVSAGSENYYVFTLDEQLQEIGKYYIELQFLKDGKVVDSATLQHTYLE